MAENYCGVKFTCRQQSDSCSFGPNLLVLNHWAWVFSEIGLTPVHEKGAYGNMSYRYHDESFVITKTGMRPKRAVDEDNFCRVDFYDHQKQDFWFTGKHKPSSECFLHDCIYRSFGSVGAIMHGHSTLMNEAAVELNIPVTDRFCDYGTPELADSALEIISMTDKIIILKDHGFVAIGDSIAEASGLVLEKYMQLLSLLRETTGKNE